MGRNISVCVRECALLCEQHAIGHVDLSFELLSLLRGIDRQPIDDALRIAPVSTRRDLMPPIDLRVATLF